MSSHPKRIAILGPESTGKSVLAEFLGAHYHEPWVPEYARQYLQSLNYTKGDLLTILEAQTKLQEEMTREAEKIIFFDTEAIILKVWSEEMYNSVDPGIIQRITDQKIDLYLLTYYDLEWKEDILREGRSTRKYLFNRYREELDQRGFRYKIIRGNFYDRAYAAIQAVESIMA